MNGVVLLTGATGFLGTHIARRVISETELLLVVLVRGDSLEVATRRLEREWWTWPELREEIGKRVQVVVGDVSEPRMGLSDEDYGYLEYAVTHIIHSAADLRLNGPLHEMRRNNVDGTENVLKLAKTIHSKRGLMRLSHVSTAYVSGGRRGIIGEQDLTDSYGFFNTYELTKYEAEKLVRDSGDEIPISIFRPGMIVGDSMTGAVRTFNTIYYPLRLYLKGGLRVLPAEASFRINIVPVDYVASSLVKLTFLKEAEGLTFHLTTPYDDLPTIGELISFVRSWAKDNLQLSLPQVLFLPLPTPKPGQTERLLGTPKSGGSLNGKFSELRPYFSCDKRFRVDNIERLLGRNLYDWRRICPNLLRYAVYHGLMHRVPRTVYEQILSRLGGRSMRVSIKDVIEGRVIKRENAEVRRDIISAAGALLSLGVTKGDRVAIVGLNSSRYLTLDVAIGLVGAVSVPLYYTSPPNEIRGIFSDCSAKLLMVGAPEILERVSEIELDLPVVSFCRESPKSPVPNYIGWEEFLALGAGYKGEELSPVDFGDLATVRYTSGTTGKPKGVCFNHGNLRWIGEAVSSLFPWAAKSKEITYLSFLPINHVVEGIIGAYAPYYAPTRLNIVFLEDFRELQTALPRVRPTVFFSVPRFYEKMWDALHQSSIGELYLGSRGLKRALFRPLVKYAILARAGLDRCSQLLVGSAPMSERLVHEYRELGIEIHNAYGMTEAPLITMNLLGRNRPGTVGEPLPETEVKIGGDGEVLVKGPQVTAGYLNEAGGSTIKDGFLATGDLGRIDGGHLVVEGRKKELIKTSYGKYVQPVKIEGMLREIPNVEDAMIVGEGRPYCVALIWVKRGVDRARASMLVDQAVSEVNNRLSHPEQLKRWVMLDNDLSISKGDLTANLKLKRKAITARLNDMIDGIYSGHLSQQLGNYRLGGS